MLRILRFGGIGYPIKAERQYEDLYKQTKRWTYRGKPIEKAKKLKDLERRLEMAISACKGYLRQAFSCGL
jgi:hypothetical protein